MNQGFKLKFDEMRQNDVAGSQQPPDVSQDVALYPSQSLVRNVCFIWLDGKRLFLNYAYLVSCEYAPETSAITLFFTSHTIVLNGTRLAFLFDDLMNHLPKTIGCTDTRYETTVDYTVPLVTSITATINTQ